LLGKIHIIDLTIIGEEGALTGVRARGV